MCVAVVVPAGESLTEAQFRAMHASNRDSWGFGWHNRYADAATNTNPNRPLGYVTHDKDITNTDAAWDKYQKELVRNRRQESPHLVHFRIRTAGRNNQVNAHPFHINGGLLIHNGHISGSGGPNGNDDYSDTYYFAKVFANSLHAGMTPEQKKFLGGIIGNYNKLAMLHTDGTVTIINEEAGHRLPNGIWVSNAYWQRNLHIYNSDTE